MSLGINDFAEGQLGRLYDLFGAESVLIPINLGEKGPTLTGWQLLSLSETRAPQFQRQLKAIIRRGGNIGVVQGEVSGDLVAVDIDDDEYVEPFFALNPKLKLSTRTRGARGLQVHLRMATQNYPRATKTLKTPRWPEVGRVARRRRTERHLWSASERKSLSIPRRSAGY